MEVVCIDGMDEQDFRRSIEDMLRLNQVDAAVERLRAMLESCAGVHAALPPRFLEVSSRDVEFGGWHRLADRVLDHDRPNHPISAIGVTLADARALGGPGPSRGRLAPFIKTFYFSDDAYPFSDATRDDLLDGYSRDGFEWQGDYEATDATLSIKGIDDLYGAIVELEDRLLDSPNPAAEDIRAGTIGACYLAALIHQSLRETIRSKGLPRSLCVLAACDGVYPFFDAPVAGSDEYAPKASADSAPGAADSEERDLSAADDEEAGEEVGETASLLSLISRKGAKAPVMMLDEADVREAVRLGELAEAERLAGGDEEALQGLLDGAQAARLAEAAATDGDTAWGDADLLNQQAELEDYAAVVTESMGRTLPEFAVPGDAQDDPGEWECDRAAAGFGDTGEVVPDLPAHAIAGSAELAKAPFAAPASHSLRARIRLAEPDSRDTFGDRVRAAVRWIRRSILRH